MVVNKSTILDKLYILGNHRHQQREPQTRPHHSPRPHPLPVS